MTVTLVVPDNSFQSYTDAVTLAGEIPNISNWVSASQTDRTVALLDACDKLKNLGYRVRINPAQDKISWAEDMRWQYEYILFPTYWQNMTAQDLAQYPSFFLKALCKAQIVQADVILGQAGGDSIEAKRDAGILSETIGQSSMMYRSITPLRLHVDRRALQYISQYLERNCSLVRI